MSLQTRLSLLFVALSLIPIAVISYFAFDSSRRYIEQSTTDHIVAINSLKEAELRRWIEDDSILLRSLSTRPLVIDFAAAMTSSAPSSPQYLKAAGDLLNDHFLPVLDERRFQEIFLLDPLEGRVLLCTEGDRHVGKYRNAEPYFSEGKSRTFVQNPYYSLGEDVVLMTISTPLRDRQGGLVAVLAANLDLAEMASIMQRHSGPARSEETYLINKFHFFVTDPQPAQGVALRRSVRSSGVSAALAGKNGTALYDDYRGVPVLGAYDWIPEREMAIITEIDQAEAFQPVGELARTVLLLAVALALLAALSGILFARTLTAPLQALMRGVAEIGHGNLDYRIATKSRDEMGRLAEAFNNMTVRRKAAEEERARAEASASAARAARSLMEGIPDPAIMTGLDGAILQFNKATADFWGHGQELVGQSIARLVAGSDATKVLAAIRDTLEEGSVINLELTALPTAGSERPILMSTVLLSDALGTPQHLVVSIRDITKRKQDEDMLRKTLEDLSRSNEELQRFAYVASHDLQEPLRTISSYLQLLERRYRSKLDSDAARYMGFAVGAANRLQEMIRGLLEYSRVETQGAPFERTSFHSLMARATDNLRLAIAESGATVTHDRLPEVFVDPGQMVRLLQNLIINSIKYRGPEPPHVHISAREDGDNWIFSVQDNGVGIEPEYSEQIFVIFQRLQGRDVPGIGLGLALVRRIVERHGGRIWVESPPGRGTTFYFTIPAGDRVAAKAAQAARAGGDGSREEAE